MIDKDKKVIGKIPRSRVQENVYYEDGKQTIRCYGPHNPHYYITPEGSLFPIEISEIMPDVSAIGNIHLRRKNIVSVGFRDDNKKDKFLGLRPDEVQDGSEQLEFTIEKIEFDGKEQTIDLSKKEKEDDISTNLGNIVIQSTRQRTRQLVKVDKKINNFKVTYKVHLKGLRIEHREDLDEYWMYNNDGKFRFRLGKPYLVEHTSESYEPLIIEDENVDFVKHSLEDNGDGTYTYIKESNENFDGSVLPILYFIDADIIYSDSSDGDVRYYHATAGWDYVHDYTDGYDCRASSTYFQNATKVYKNGLRYDIGRSFFRFDTSGISGTITEVLLKIRGYNSDDFGVIAQKGTQGATLTTADYDAFSGSSYAEVASWSVTGYNTFTFNATGRSEINQSGHTEICCRNSEHDYDDVPVNTTNGNNGCYYSEYTGTDHDPYLEITASAATPIPVFMYHYNQMRRG